MVTKRPLLNFSEENSTIPNVGADMLLKTGRLEHLKKGPVYWMDSADTNPRIGEHKLVGHATGKVKMDALTQMTVRKK